FLKVKLCLAKLKSRILIYLFSFLQSVYDFFLSQFDVFIRPSNTNLFLSIKNLESGRIISSISVGSFGKYLKKRLKYSFNFFHCSILSLYIKKIFFYIKKRREFFFQRILIKFSG